MSKDAISRRTFLRATAGATATVAGATTAAAQEDGNGTAGNESSGNETAGNESAGNESSGNGSAGNESSGNESAGGSGGGGGTETVTVGAGSDGLSFDPSELSIQPGTTVVFEWASNGHNVVPNEGDWGEEEIHDEGYSFEHTFEEEATYEYVCEPHEDAGMVGTIEVSQDAGSGGGGGGGGGSSAPSVPDSAKSLGVATTFSMVATLGLGYFFIKYGGDYES
ncbi:plastocyanin/azurin family copper-binding protein [Haloprofundus salinisoli]|uniref:plastocyanin/azurin family copper-binding protein n=1 Tax=Haloprofundus salinisoli TaxID=2876193 RepID=UPI001CCFA560|nr:plastocyanin/azurin family copper-binding protein [Haloprofundus salinisoli]